MEFTLEIVVFWLLVIDSIGANLMTWTSGKAWYQKHFRLMSRYFPASKGWTSYYFILVLWMGVMLFRAGQLSF